MDRYLRWGQGLWQDKGMALSLLYVFFPVWLFFGGWLKFPLAVFFILLSLWLFLRVSRDLCVKGGRVGFGYKPEYWITVCVVVFIWVLFSGIGGFSYQNSDYFVRNPIYRDQIGRAHV